MTSSIGSDLIRQATLFQQRFTQAKDYIDTLSPKEQIDTTAKLEDDSRSFSNLQQRVEKLIRGQIQTAPGFSQEELIDLTEKLNKSAEILDSIDSNNTIAMAYQEIVLTIEQLNEGSNPDVNKVQSLLGRIKDLTEQHPFLNRGNREALEAADQVLQTMLTSQHYQPLAIQNSSNRQSGPHISGTQKILEEQNENYFASLVTDQFEDLKKDLCRDPLKDFDPVLTYYKSVKEYSLFKPSYISDKAGLTIAVHLKNAEALLNEIIQVQAKKENEQAEQTQGQAVQNQVLIELKNELQQGLEQKMMESLFPKINEIFLKLSSEEKQKLFQALDEIQKETSKRNLAITVPRLPFTIWPAAWTQKKQALEKILSETNAPPVTVAPVVVKKADEMTRRFLEVQNMQPAVQTTFQNDDLSPDDFIDIRFPPIVLDEEISEISNTHPNVLVIYDLQTLLLLLGPNASGSQLQEASQALFLMGSKGLKSAFTMSGPNPRSITDRPLYHLYFIHKNESPEKLKDDMQYGNKAFAGAYPADNEERYRAVQRTIVELVLENLEDAINFDDGETLIKLLDILEEIKLDANDRAEGQENAAYNLFGVFYHLHSAAHSNNPSLVDPQDPQFNGDFSRGAFRKTMKGIDPAIKVAAIQYVRTVLKAAWKVQ